MTVPRVRSLPHPALIAAELGRHGVDLLPRRPAVSPLGSQAHHATVSSLGRRLRFALWALGLAPTTARPGTSPLFNAKSAPHRASSRGPRATGRPRTGGTPLKLAPRPPDSSAAQPGIPLRPDLKSSGAG